MRKIIFATIDDLVGDFLFYDRKEDDSLPNGAIECAVDNKEISVDEMAAYFKEKLIEGLG